jgi:mTERF
LLQVLTLSAETIEYKLATLTGQFGLPASLILERPSLLGYSIEKRILPRMHAMRQRAAQVAEVVQMKRTRTIGRQKIRRLVKEMDPISFFNVNALYLSDAKFEKYLETSAVTRRKQIKDR